MNDNKQEWIEVGRKKPRNPRDRAQCSSEINRNVNYTELNRKVSFTPSSVFYGTPINGFKKDEIIKKKGDIVKWINNGFQIVDLEERILNRLKDLKLQSCGNIDRLWNCIHVQLQHVLNTKYRFDSSETLRNHIYENFDGCLQNDHNSMIQLSKLTSCHLIFFSVNGNFRKIDYGLNETRCAKFLHIGNDYFIPLGEMTVDEHSFSEEDRSIISKLQVSKPKPQSNTHQVKKQDQLLENLRKMLIGMERAPEPWEKPPSNGKKRPYYDTYPLTQIENDRNLKLCLLDLKSAHSAVATIINATASDKFHEINIMNRKNCGYNAFQGDIVYVKINDHDIYTGKVMGVAESNHKPINSLYICKVCKHQGSLMKPLDNFFPKIHVDNEPGRRQYEQYLKDKGKRKIAVEQLSEELRSREMTNFADNKFVSIFKLTVNKALNRPDFAVDRVIEFDPEMCTDLFIVCYQYWDIASMYPNGTVVGMLSTFDSFDDSLHLIIPICKVEPIIVNDIYKREIDSIKRQVKSVSGARYDVVPSGAMVFTVDNEDTQDMDDALSYHVKNDLIIVGVHITDITKYISPQHEIYRQAQRRFTTVYPPKEEPIYLIAKELSSNYLSLVPSQPRAVVSVMFHFKKENERTYSLTNVTYADTVIISKHKLSYKFVEKVIKALSREDLVDDVDEDLFLAIKGCYDIAKFKRRERLPYSYFVQQANHNRPGFKFDDSFNAKFLIEEFMLMANEHVAKKIYEKYPNMSLLRVQDPVTDYEAWVERIFTNTNMNFQSSLKQCCKLLYVNRTAENKKDLIVSRQYFNDFKRCVLEHDWERARNMLQYDAYINDFLVYLIEWYRLNSPARYQCSIANSLSNRHFTLNKDLYTHFTSPVRRFSDVIVHRLFKSAVGICDVLETLDDHEISEVCTIGNKKRKLSKYFENICEPYAIFAELTSSNSFIIDCICGDISNDELRLVHPTLERASSVKSLKFAHLSLDEPPVSLKMNQFSDNCQLKWKKIIFSYEPAANTSKTSKFLIDNHLHDAKLPDSAHKVFSEVRRSYLPSLELDEKLQHLSRQFRISDYEQRITSDSNSLADPIIDIDLNLFIKNTLRIQFCSLKANGLKRVTPELFVVYDTLQLCLIHQQDPVMCFVPGGKLVLKHNDIILKFTSITEYKEYFTPLIYVESLMEILSEKSEFTLIDLKINWISVQSRITKKQEIHGIIRLNDKFCTSKNIIFSDERDKTIDRYEYVISDGLQGVCGDLLCIRSKKDNGDTYWIGHGEVLNVCKVKDVDDVDTNKIVFFILTQHNSEIFNAENDRNYSIDVYLRSVVSKRQLEAVTSTDTNFFMKQVILGDQIPPTISQNDEDMIDFVFNELRKQRIPNPNYNQKTAIRKALTEKLSLIWGPPGTGKTSIGCILAFAYTQINIRVANDGVVLYCGPSNDCVNLVAIEMQRKFVDFCPKLLRIFGQTQELADFPLPGFFNRNNKPLTVEMQKISLHFLIREMDDPVAKSLKKYDDYFENIRKKTHLFDNGVDIRSVIHEMIKQYKFVVKEAKEKLLEKERYNMVICTTSVSATRIMEQFKITQVIIDEAGMCKEPETLIPILSAAGTVENVVLIGDHKQLRPIIHSNLANKRGLQISMFERYQTLRRDLVTMLNYQYRMHPSICEFPSTYFYSSKLRTNMSSLWSGLTKDDIIYVPSKNPSNDSYKDPYRDWNGIDYRWAVPHYESILKQSNYNAICNEEWPGRRRQPYKSFKAGFNLYPERLVFIHMVGDESVQSISTAAGNENSRCNDVEVHAVGTVYEKLLGRLLPPRQAPNFITVLTQYKLQEDKLFKKCKDILQKRKAKLDPIVKTVIRSQGSENDYIIFSTVRSIRNREDIVDRASPGWERQYLGFITDQNQVNVALTRAKKGLIIIGNKNLLSVNKMWKDLIDNLDSRGCLLNDVTEFLNH